MTPPPPSAGHVSAARVAALVGEPTTRPVYASLADRLRLLVADGRLPVGTRLPSERDLSAALGLSRTTVARSYAALRDSGYLASRVGAGSVATLPAGTVRRGGRAILPAATAAGEVDLTCAATRAPSGVLAAYEQAVQELPRYLTGAGYHVLGLPELREVIAERYTERGAPTSPDQVMITAGAVAGIAVVMRALLQPGDRVVVETPTYPNSVEALRSLGARLVPVAVEPDGWDLPTLRSSIAATRARAAVLIPDFHNPTGALMSDPDRASVARAMRRAGTVPVIDETIAEVSLDAGELPRAFAAHHPGTLSVGSSSKTHWGGLRTGWLRAPIEVMPRLVDARATVDLGAPILEQLTLLTLMRAGVGLSEERRAELVEARDALISAVREQLPRVRFRVPRGGLSLWLELPTANATAVVLAAEAEGLYLASGPRFAVAHGLERWLRFPYVLPPDVLRDAVGRLARAIDAVTAGTPSAHAARGRTAAGRPIVA